MQYISTRGQTAPTSLSHAILAGLAPDGGLYVPTTIPKIDAKTLLNCNTLADLAAPMLQPFFITDYLQDALPDIAKQAFSFDAPLRFLIESKLAVLELFHGPTAAFKDFGACFLAATIKQLQLKNNFPTTILVATSGDTGSAVASAFHHIPGIRVVILYPEGRVSKRQAHQLECFGDNVTTLRVNGTFDDCQRLVKTTFTDQALRDKIQLASANSISLGRLLPQMIYYGLAALKCWRHQQQPLNFVIPTGNLGNAFAALLAREMGLPIGHIVLATNANQVLYEYINTGIFKPRDSQTTLANAMDVGNPSNLERLRWLFPDHNHASAQIQCLSISDDQITDCIKYSETRYGEIWCPHTACAVTAYEQIQQKNLSTQVWCVVSTAHPAKFDTIVEPLIQHTIEMPDTLQSMLKRPANATRINVDIQSLYHILLNPMQY